jgi:hypothetical protein
MQLGVAIAPFVLAGLLWILLRRGSEAPTADRRAPD